MAKAKMKTTPIEAAAAEFIATVEHPVRRSDAEYLLGWFEEVTGWPAKMWGPSIVGFGRYEYKYESGREGESMITGFSPRKANLVMYVMPGYRELGEPLSRLGKHKLGKSCLYINKLADIELEVLQEIVVEGSNYMQANYQTYKV